MRERYLEAYDAIRIDCLNGDKYKTGKVAPDGSPDPSIFSTEGDPVGIQVGTAIATLVRKAEHAPAREISFRHLWGQIKREGLLETAEVEPGALYGGIRPVLPLGLPFVQTAVSADWFDWPALPDLFPVAFPGVQTKRDSFLVDVDVDRLRERIAIYFNSDVGHEEIARRYPGCDERVRPGSSYGMPVPCATRSLHAGHPSTPALSATRTGRSTIAGFTGNLGTVCLVVPYPTTGPTCSTGICG